MPVQRVLTNLLGLTFFVLTLTAYAQPADSADKEAIRSLISKCANALQSQDWATLESICSKDWTHLTDRGDRWDMATMKSFFGEHITDHTIKFNIVGIHISGDASMAWATFDEDTAYKFDGNPVKQNAVFTAVFEKEQDAWKMKLLHRSTPPPPQEEDDE